MERGKTTRGVVWHGVGLTNGVLGEVEAAQGVRREKCELEVCRAVVTDLPTTATHCAMLCNPSLNAASTCAMRRASSLKQPERGAATSRRGSTDAQAALRLRPKLLRASFSQSAAAR